MDKDTPKNKDSSRSFRSHQKFAFLGRGVHEACLLFFASMPSQLDSEKGRGRRASLRVTKCLCTADEQETGRDPKQHSALCPFLSSLKQKILSVCDIFTKDKNKQEGSLMSGHCPGHSCPSSVSIAIEHLLWLW